MRKLILIVVALFCVQVQGQSSCTPSLEGVEINLQGEGDPEIEARVSEMFQADQEAREGDIDWEVVSREDRERRIELLEYLKKGEVTSGAALYNAAFIFQHGGCPASYKLANELAEAAIEQGNDEARWIYAATLDRYLLSIGEVQKFGTQYMSTDGCLFELEPTDPNTTDEERAEYGVPAFAEASEPQTFGETCD